MSAPADKGKNMEDLLVTRIEDYRKYFSDSEVKDDKLDHQGTTAYINLMKLVMSIREAQGAENAKNEEELKKLGVKILREVYGIER